MILSGGGPLRYNSATSSHEDVPMLRHFAASLVCWLCLMAYAPPIAAQSGIRPPEMIQLKEQLETGLRARRPIEFAYIQQVVDAVENEQLPLLLVKSTFHYARQKRPYPFQYFQRTLRIRAKEVGLMAP